VTRKEPGKGEISKLAFCNVQALVDGKSSNWGARNLGGGRRNSLGRGLETETDLAENQSLPK